MFRSLSGVLRGGFFDPKKLPKDFVQELIRSGHRPGYARVETAYFRGLKSYCAARQVYSRVKAPGQGCRSEKRSPG
jgi:hypothetical protein